MAAALRKAARPTPPSAVRALCPLISDILFECRRLTVRDVFNAPVLLAGLLTDAKGEGYITMPFR